MDKMKSISSEIPIKKNVEKMMTKVFSVLFAIPFFYLVVYYFYPAGISISLLMLFFILPLLILALKHFKKYNASKIFGLLGYNFCLFLISGSESRSTGVYLHFVSCCAVAIVLFSYPERWKSFLFIALSTILYLATNLFSFELLPFRNITPTVANVLFVIHTVGVTLISSFCIYLVLGNNYAYNKGITLSKEVIENKNEELKKINEELDRFVYSASHDLKAPLSTIGGLVNLMEMDKYQPHSELTEKIKKQIQAMQNFINDIVHYSRNSRAEVEWELINLNQLINDIHHSLLHFENADKVTFNNNVAPDYLIKSDEHRLKVILSNIIGNAFKYADLNKVTPSIEISFHQKEHGSEIQIVDNGQGIRSEHVSKLFSMFYRASSTSKGSGLGLYIAMESAKKMNWSIGAMSEFGKGTVFTIHIPQLHGDKLESKKIPHLTTI
jgi:signal transduction histidine kinase